jgi:hypothetical protein
MLKRAKPLKTRWPGKRLKNKKNFKLQKQLESRRRAKRLKPEPRLKRKRRN